MPPTQKSASKDTVAMTANKDGQITWAWVDSSKKLFFVAIAQKV